MKLVVCYSLVEEWYSWNGRHITDKILRKRQWLRKMEENRVKEIDRFAIGTMIQMSSGKCLLELLFATCYWRQRKQLEKSTAFISEWNGAFLLSNSVLFYIDGFHVVQRGTKVPVLRKLIAVVNVDILVFSICFAQLHYRFWILSRMWRHFLTFLWRKTPHVENWASGTYFGSLSSKFWRIKNVRN